MLRPHDDDWGDGDGCAGGDAEDPLVAGEDAASQLRVAQYIIQQYNTINTIRINTQYTDPGIGIICIIGPPLGGLTWW